MQWLCLPLCSKLNYILFSTSEFLHSPVDIDVLTPPDWTKLSILVLRIFLVDLQGTNSLLINFSLICTKWLVLGACLFKPSLSLKSLAIALMFSMLSHTVSRVLPCISIFESYKISHSTICIIIKHSQMYYLITLSTIVLTSSLLSVWRLGIVSNACNMISYQITYMWVFINLYIHYILI